MIRKLLLLLPILLASLSCTGDQGRPGSRNYLDSLRSFWQTLYPNGGETLYCGYRFHPFDRKVNAEHVYPMSWVTRQLRCGTRERCRHTSTRFNLIESDMHNIYPALAEVNEARGAMAYGEVPGERHAFPGCDIEIDYRKRRVEPRPQARGRIARALLYMADTYGLTLFQRQRKLMERWNRRYPPDDEERRHNRQVAALQGQPNPWIQSFSGTAKKRDLQ